MAELSKFFKESDTRMGVFYPTHYLIAIFESEESAKQAGQKLINGGFAEEDVLAAGGREFVELAKPEPGLTHALMQTLARFFSTEQHYADNDLEHARGGAGFLAVYCPTEHLKTQAWARLRPENVLDARYYYRGGIEHLAGDFIQKPDLEGGTH